MMTPPQSLAERIRALADLDSNSRLSEELYSIAAEAERIAAVIRANTSTLQPALDNAADALAKREGGITLPCNCYEYAESSGVDRLNCPVHGGKK